MAWSRPNDKPLSKPMVVSLPTHIYVTLPHWVHQCQTAPRHQQLQCSNIYIYVIFQHVFIFHDFQYHRCLMITFGTTAVSNGPGCIVIWWTPNLRRWVSTTTRTAYHGQGRRCKHFRFTTGVSIFSGFMNDSTPTFCNMRPAANRQEQY